MSKPYTLTRENYERLENELKVATRWDLGIVFPEEKPLIHVLKGIREVERSLVGDQEHLERLKEDIKETEERIEALSKSKSQYERIITECYGEDQVNAFLDKIKSKWREIRTNEAPVIFEETDQK